MRIYERLRGRLRVEIFGAFPESVLNSAALAAIELWDLECIDGNTLRLSLYENELDSFAEVVRRCMCEYRLLSSEGGSRDRKMLKRRFWLILLAAVTAGLLLLSSLFIWEIDVRGNEKLSRGEILRALSACGVESGSYWPSLSSDLIRSEMIARLPDIGWMSVNVNSSRAVVLIVEREERPEIYSESAACDIVAAKTGIIRRLSVLNGKPAVAPGQAVAEGELLVGGRMDAIVAGQRYVCAKARVMADTWYELCAVTPLSEQAKDSSPLSRSRFAIIFGKRRINLYFNGGKAIDECDKIIHEYTLSIDGLFAMPLRIVREELRRYDVSPREASDASEMEALLRSRLPRSADAELLSQSFTQSSGRGLLVLSLRAHCLEDIGRSIPIQE